LIPRLRFDVWFWALVFWTIMQPFLIDENYTDRCLTSGRITFVPLSSLWSDDSLIFACTPIQTDHQPGRL
jgi:hypothetical protein